MHILQSQPWFLTPLPKELYKTLQLHWLSYGLRGELGLIALRQAQSGRHSFQAASRRKKLKSLESKRLWNGLASLLSLLLFMSCLPARIQVMFQARRFKLQEVCRQYKYPTMVSRKNCKGFSIDVHSISKNILATRQLKYIRLPKMHFITIREVCKSAIRSRHIVKSYLYLLCGIPFTYCHNYTQIGVSIISN